MEEHWKKQRIGEILLENGLVTKDQLEEALKTQKRQGGLLGVILVESGFLKEEDLAFALARQFNYPFLSLEHVTANRNLIREIDLELMTKYCFFPIEKMQGIMVVAMADPSDEMAIKEIEEKTSARVLAFVSGVKQIEDQLRRAFNIKGENRAKSGGILKKAAENKQKGENS